MKIITNAVNPVLKKKKSSLFKVRGKRVEWPCSLSSIRASRNNFLSAASILCQNQKNYTFEKMRSAPNIIITGTPGVGKTTHSEILAERTGLRHVSVNQIVKDKECHEGWDDEYQSWIVDEDKV